MKLISCHIVRFGRFADEDFSFASGLSGVLRENGAGKSTLTAFLSAMLYGLPTVNRRGVDFNDREHFRPYGGGSFGGSLLFSTDAGDEYRVERTFDEKSAAKDGLTVYRNGAAFDCGERQIGEILFEVDADAFARTVFLSADTLDPEPGESLADRLCEAVEKTEGTVPAEKALAALDEAATAVRKKKGKNGLLDQADAAAVEIETRLRDAKIRAGELPALRNEASTLNAALTAAKSRSLWASYDDALALAKAAESELKEVDARFEGGVPDEAELAQTERSISNRESAARDAAREFVPSQRQSELALRFENRRPDEAALAAMEEKAKLIRDAQATAIPTTAPEPPAPAAVNRNAAPTLLAIGGGLMLLAGLILLILSNVIPGALLLAGGVLSLGAAALFLFQGKVAALEKSIAVVDPGGVERARRAQLDADLAALLAPYGYTSDDGALAAFRELKRDLAALDETEEEKKKFDADLAAAKERLAALDAALSAFFARLGVTTDAGFRSAMNELRKAIRDREILVQKIRDKKDEADRFAARHGLTDRPTDGGAADADAIAELERRKTALAVKIHDVESVANGIPALEDALADANEKIKELKSRYARLTKAHELLTAAQDALVGTYVDPVKSAFVGYADALSSFLGKSVSLDSHFVLTFDADGALRDHRHLSAGERSVASLCLRMALADSLYAGKEQPPLVLDDPLVHLDENNLEKAKALLREVAKKRQIVCLTCHGSRAV